MDIVQTQTLSWFPPPPPPAKKNLNSDIVQTQTLSELRHCLGYPTPVKKYFNFDIVCLTQCRIWSQGNADNCLRVSWTTWIMSELSKLPWLRQCSSQTMSELQIVCIILIWTTCKGWTMSKLDLDNLSRLSKLDNVKSDNVWVANCLHYFNLDNLSRPDNVEVGLGLPVWAVQIWECPSWTMSKVQIVCLTATWTTCPGYWTKSKLKIFCQQGG